ncbi:threonine/homoserine efflux transporter RhtA [Pseudomonas duriflava]|uniref:Threonine/homoserine efflux transporter RhtA n=1 Tax=Pseudomonas duriflava TaxID=459528 RepID=A0A562PX45_9PSED|nr:DMT family transporter [Pseudomonas duriflava]TWI48994.1 threonine/homoserine efflux transporter RhtA [Pseudomonas duriflava]
MLKRQLYLLLLVLGTAFWGISFSLVKTGVADGSPFVFLAYKFGIAVLVLAIIFARRLMQLTWHTVFAGSLIGLPLLIGNVLQTIGLQHTSVTNSAFITGLDVLLIPLFKWSIFKKPVPKRVWLSCVIALTGLYLIVARNGLHLNVGDLWTMACAIFFASYVLSVGYFSNKHDAMLTVVIALAVCSLGCLFAAMLDKRAIWVPAEPFFWRGVLFASLFATAYMYAVQSAAQRYLEEEKVALTYLCEPVFAAFAGMLLLGESLSLRTVIGAVFILTALVLAEININKQQA